VSEVFKPKDEDGAKEGGAEKEGPTKGRRLPPALDAKLKFRAQFKDESDAQEEEQAYGAQNEAVETTAEVSLPPGPKSKCRRVAHWALLQLMPKRESRTGADSGTFLPIQALYVRFRHFMWRKHGCPREDSL
jgi:hypothetical protein